jgi:succinyl-CoA synthetase beta subunit
VDGPDAAVLAATRLTGPVVVKLSSPDIRHKTDVGAVVLGVTGEAAVREAVTRLRALPGHHATGLLVEAMTAPGLELMISIRRDGAVPVLVVALGGVWVELLDDAVLIPLPVDHAIVRERILRLRAAPLITGGRGRTPVDVAGLCHLAAVVAEVCIAEDLQLVELNPLAAGQDAVVVLDAVIRSGPPA